MFTKRTKWVLFIGSILGILICVIGCVNLIASSTFDSSVYNERYPSRKSPIRTLSIRVDEDQREELFAQLRKFSDKLHFEFHLSFYSFEKHNDRFSVEMFEKGLEILAASKPIDTTELDIDFYEEDPTNPPSQETVDEVYNDLKVYISEIPNVKIIEEK